MSKPWCCLEVLFVKWEQLPFSPFCRPRDTGRWRKTYTEDTQLSAGTLSSPTSTDVTDAKKYPHDYGGNVWQIYVQTDAEHTMYGVRTGVDYLEW